MLQQIRDKSGSKIFYSLLMALMIAGMAFFGMGDYSFGGAKSFVAKVGDQIITEDDFARRLDEQKRQMRSMLGDSYNPKMFDTPQFRRQLLDQLIDEELITQAGSGAGMGVSDSRVREEIGKIEAFKPTGVFDEEVYRELLSRNGMSPMQFQERMRRDIAVRELPSQINATALVTETDLDTFIRLRDQLRTFKYAVLPPKPVLPEDISDDQVKAYFDAHSIEYATPEQVSIEYVELRGAELMPATPDDNELLKRYNEQSHRFGTQEQRLVSHILIEVAENADAEAQKAAQQKADQIAAEVESGKDFAELATSSSDDIGSKAVGGDLGWIERGTLEPAFEAAMFALEAGKTSAPVRTNQGYHVIQVREVRPAAMKPFEEVRAELAAEFVEEDRVARFTDLQDLLFDAADHTSGTLEPLAKAINADVKTSEFFSRDFGAGIGMNPDVRAAAFSLEVKDDGLTSEPIDIGREHVVVLRMAQHKASQPRTLEEASDEVRALLVAEANIKAAREGADAAFKRMLGGESLDSIATALGGSVVTAEGIGRQGSTHDAALISEVFKMAKPGADQPTQGMAKINDNSYALVLLQSVVDGDPAQLDEAARTAARDQLRQELATTESDAFRKALRARVPIKIDESRI